MPDLDDNLAWLQKNRELRMDANVDLFPEERRRFHLARYEFARPYCEGKRVLDGACGTGYGSNILGQVAREVRGIDCSSEAIEYACRTYTREHVLFEKSFVEATSFPSGSFDVVVSFETVEHTLCPESHMMEIVRLLEPNAGQAIVSVPNAWGLTDHHFLDFDMPLFERLVSRFFGETEFFYQNPPSHTRHPGIGALISSAPSDAQCLLAICRKPKKESVTDARNEHIMDEIYRIAFQRHRDYLSMAYRQNTNLARRVINKLRSMS